MQDKSLDHLRRLDGLLSGVLDLPPEKRIAFLEESCPDDTALRNEVLTLLENDSNIDHLLNAMAGHGETDPTLPRSISFVSEPTQAIDPFGLVGRVVSNYRIIEVIGRGGMGIVYKGQDQKLDRFVALKFLSPKLLEDQATRERFINEARAASILDHPHIGIIHEIGETDDNRLFIAMTLYEGDTLKTKMKKGRLDIKDVVRYITQIAEGLEFSHRRGVIHRDIKPSNIIVSAENNIKIVDFGLATFSDKPIESDSGRIMGTVGYMAPEQLKGKSADSSADIWATGVVLHEMLFGEKPERAIDGSVDIESSSSSQTSSSHSLLAAQLTQIAAKALQHKPEDRYPSMKALLKDLRQLQPVFGNSLLQKTAAAIIMRPVAAMFFSFALAIIGFFGWTRLGPHNADATALKSIGIELLEDYYSGDDEDVYLTRGITEEFMLEFTRFDALKVVSLINSGNTERSPEDFAQALGLTWMLQGSVYNDDGRVRLAMQVREIESSRIVASVNEEEDLEDLQALIHDVALRLVDNLNIPLNPDDEQLFADVEELNPEAFDLFLQGRFHVEMETPDHLEQAIKHFEAATLHESGFARAYASMVVPYYLLGHKYQRMPTNTAFFLAKQNAEKALTLDETLPAAHVAQGVVRELIDHDYEGAERSFKRAIALNPEESEARREYGLLLLRKGDIEEGIKELNQAIELTPTSVQVYRDLGRAYFYNEEYDKAIEQLQDLLRIQPGFVRAYKFLALSYLQKGMFDQAERDYSRALQLDKSENEVDNISFYGEIEALKGERDKALTTVERMISIREAQGSGGSASIALVYTRLGMYDEAIHWLRIGQQEGSLPPSIIVDPRWKPLRDIEEFQQIVANAMN